MALSYTSVQAAYKVFNALKKEFGTPKTIPSWPDDMQQWSASEKQYPSHDIVYGFDKKSDDGWENIYFFVQNPSKALIDRFKQLAKTVPNSTLCNRYNQNPKLFIIGWF